MDVIRVATVMTPFPHHVDAHEDLVTARAMMQEHAIRHLPVIRDGQLAGIVTLRDIEIAMAIAGPGVQEVRIPVWSVCEREPYVVDLDTPIADVASTLADRQIGSAIVTRKGKLAGIITTVDICRAFADLTRRGDEPDDVA
jgi:acetoin utilization protein AcuB